MKGGVFLTETVQVTADDIDSLILFYSLATVNMTIFLKEKSQLVSFQIIKEVLGIQLTGSLIIIHTMSAYDITWSIYSVQRKKALKLLQAFKKFQKENKWQMSRTIVLVGRVFINGPGDRGSIPGQVIPKTKKMELDTSLLNTQHYKVRIKGKVEQSRKRSSVLPYSSV